MPPHAVLFGAYLMRLRRPSAESGRVAPDGAPVSTTPHAEQTMPRAGVESVVRTPTPPTAGNAGIGTDTGVGVARTGSGTDQTGKSDACTDIHTLQVTGS